jgi:hypothetical protein
LLVNATRHGGAPSLSSLATSPPPSAAIFRVDTVVSVRVPTPGGIVKVMVR